MCWKNRKQAVMRAQTNIWSPEPAKAAFRSMKTWFLSPVIWPLLNNTELFSLFGYNAWCESIQQFVGKWRFFPLPADSGFCSAWFRFWLRRQQIFRIRISTRVPVKNDCVQEKALWFIEHRDLSDPLRQLRSFNAAWLSPKWIPVIRRGPVQLINSSKMEKPVGGWLGCTGAAGGAVKCKLLLCHKSLPNVNESSRKRLRW